MKILFLNHNVARRGGTYFRAFHVARGLVALGHSVTLLTISAHCRLQFSREWSDGVEIVQTPDLMEGVGRTGWDLWDTAARVAFLRGREWDIVHAWDCRPVVILPALYARNCSRRLNCKLVIDWCDWWGRGGLQAERPDGWFKHCYSPIETFFEEAFRTRADATTVTSEALRQRAVRLGVSSHRMLILPGGSDCEAIHPQEMAGARAALNLPRDSFLVGYMGSLPATEVRLLLDTVTQLRTTEPHAVLLAIGVSVSGSRKSFQQVAGPLWRDWILETGRVPFSAVSTYLAACNALVLPMRESISNCARWPSKINDYLASGRPVVATRVGAIVDFLEGSGAALLTRCDAPSISGALLHLRFDQALATRVGGCGRRLAQSELSWKAIVGRLNEFYKTIAPGMAHDAAPSELRAG